MESAALSDTFGRYVGYRLRLFGWTQLAACLAHAIEYVVLRRTLPGDGGLRALLGLHCVLALMLAFYWGALSPTRDRIQACREQRLQAELGRTLDRTMTVATLFSGMCIGAACALAGWAAVSPSGAGVGFAFGAAAFVRLGVSAWARAYHSCAFALRRVYRPAWSLLVLEGVGVATALALPRGWILAQIARLVLVALLAAALSAYFTTAAWERLGLRPPRIGLRSLRRRWSDRRADADRSPFAEAMFAGFAAAGMQLGPLLALSGLAVAGGLAGVLYLVAPCLTASASWTRLFYFDLRRFTMTSHRALDRRLRGALRWTSWLVGATAGAAAVVMALVAREPVAPVWLLSLVPLGLALGSFSLEQMSAFAARDYRRALTGAVALAACTLGAPTLARLAGDGRGQVDACGPTLAACVALGSTRRRREARRGGADEPLRGLGEWLDALAAQRGPVHVGFAHIARERDLARLRASILRRLQDEGAVATVDGPRLLWFMAAARGGGISLTTMVRATGGLATGLRTSPEACDVREALIDVRRWILGRHALADLDDASPGLVRERFAAQFPAGVIIDLSDPSGDPDAVPAEGVALVRAALAQAGGDWRSLRLPDLTLVGVEAPGGVLTRLYLARAPRSGAVRAFRRTLDATLLSAAIARAGRPSVPPSSSWWSAPFGASMTLRWSLRQASVARVRSSDAGGSLAAQAAIRSLEASHRGGRSEVHAGALPRTRVLLAHPPAPCSRPPRERGRR